jgi:integrase/recombinase XerD
MSALAPTLQAFFTHRLIDQRHASPNTIAAYRDTFRLLLGYIHQHNGKPPSRLRLDDLDAPVITGFLAHLESARGCSPRTRNARLAAIHSMFRYAALHHPEHAELIQRVLAIPTKRHDTTIVSFLTRAEIDALLAAPDRTTRLGRRDHAIMLLTIQTGLRVSELTGLRRRDIHLGTGAHVRCHGKGRKQRATPLTTQTVDVLAAWLDELGGNPDTPLFPGRDPTRALSRDAVRRLVAKHAATAQGTCPSLRSTRVSPHLLRHTAAMLLLQAGVDTAVIALWLGHESIEATNIYLVFFLHFF